MNALDELSAVLFEWVKQDSVIKPRLSCDGTGNGVRWWRVHLVETSTNAYTNQYDKCVGWSVEKLKDWPDCKRMSFDMWDFKHRKDAEKFITLFHLSWEQ